ncbi:hypothetical protein [Deinococcus multiflagellatus]|uniref:Uncharacterized protein n=1 Tax=Deinococcus multiflagellatus TaxID=1656887 RepID=A0ABW1ZLV9_9DEIO|nr:hypothetical protein [Deinococcus multiflagellatus]MBZ9714862.1 hypothetical protein [Deinococcus multiflagellatus]
MFRLKKHTAQEGFSGSAFETALTYCQRNETLHQLNNDQFAVELGGHSVFVRRANNDAWLEADSSFQIDQTNSASADVYSQIAKMQFDHMTLILDRHEGKGVVRFSQLMRYQGQPEKHIFNMLSAFDYFLNRSEERNYPTRDFLFFCDGKKFTNATDALLFYFKTVRRCRIVDRERGYVAFDVGGATIVVSLITLPHEFILRCAFSDFEKLIQKDKNALTPHYFAAAYRKPPLHTASYCFENGISELAISGTLTAGTEARPIFTATLSALYQVLLDSTERIKMNPDLLTGKQQLHSEEESIQQAKKYEGDKTGGVEFLSDA